MKKLLLSASFVTLLASIAFASDKIKHPGMAQPLPRSEEDHDKATAASILAARQKAVDDLRAGRAALYYFAGPPMPNSSSLALNSHLRGPQSHEAQRAQWRRRSDRCIVLAARAPERWV
jgi:hypothetical protein